MDICYLDALSFRIFSLSQSLWSVIREFESASSSQSYLLSPILKLTTFVRYEIIII